MLHHVDLRDGLRRLRSLVAPGGRLVITRTTAQTVRIAREELPGVRFRRLVLFRHLLVWDAQ
jgi:hypothetical protein